MISEKYFCLTRLGVVSLIVCVASSAFPQSIKTPAAGEGSPQKELALERLSLIAELQSLEKETLRFGDPLSEASAKIEIADAAWELDRSWAKTLVRGAYELSLPRGAQRGGQNRPAGSPPVSLGGVERARQKIRFRALQVARRDKDFADELLQMEAESFGADGRHFASASLADYAIGEGDVGASAEYIIQGIKADPTGEAAPGVINQVAVRDRALADRLIIQYIGELRAFPISSKERTDGRIFSTLSDLANATFIPDPSLKIPPPGSEVMRAYVGYMLEALKSLEQQEPGYLRRRRPTLLSLWIPLQQHAPEMAGVFLNLEGRSRKSGDASSLPTAASAEEEKRLRYERSVKRALEGEQPHEGPVYSAIARGDFDKARRMIAKFPDGPQKTRLLETANLEEAVMLATNGDIYSAETLAKDLKHATSASRIYPVLIKESVAKKDKPRAARLVYQAIQRMKDSDTSPPPVPQGIPVSAVESDKRFDPVLLFIARLAIDVLPHNELALTVLDELVSAANAAPAETEHGQLGFDPVVFRTLAPENESRVRQAADSLKNPVQRVLAFSAIYQWKAKEIIKAQAKPIT